MFIRFLLHILDYCIRIGYMITFIYLIPNLQILGFHNIIMIIKLYWFWSRRTDGQTDGRTHRRTDGWTEGQTEGKTDGRPESIENRCRELGLLDQGVTKSIINNVSKFCIVFRAFRILSNSQTNKYQASLKAIIT